MEKFNLKDELKGVDSQWHECMDLSGLKEKEIYYSSPSKGQVFNAFKLFEPSETKILILGQDPYPSKNDNEGRAHGLAFSFGPNAKKKEADDSLLNIFKAIKAYKNEDFKFDEVIIEQIIGDEDKKIKPWKTNLEEWAKKYGVLLLNTALTYESEEKIKSHQEVWNPFVTHIIYNLIKNKLIKKDDKLAVFLWGVSSQQLFYRCIKDISECEFSKKLNSENFKKLNNKKLISVKEEVDINKNLKIFITSHPCNKSAWRGFKDNAPNHFKACDEFLGTDTWKNFPENNK